MRILTTLRTLIVCCVLAVATTGCFTVDMLFKVRPDGSGTIEVTSTVKKQFVEQLAAFAGGEGEGEGGVKDLFSEAQLKETGEKLGPGVKLVRHEPISTEDAEGVRAFYSFTDIGALRADAMEAAPGQSSGGDEREGVDFSFEKGGEGRPSVITATMPGDFAPEEEAAEAPPEKTAEGAGEAGGEGAAAEEFSMDDPQMQMFAQMFAGLKVRVALEVEGKLIRSNAPKVEGNRSTLLELDFDKILANPETLAKLMAAEPSSLAEMQKLTADVPGLVIPTVEELRIEFEGK